MMTMMMICLFTCSSAISCRHSGVTMMMVMILMMMMIMVIYLFTRSSALSWRQSGVMTTMMMTTTAR